MHRRSKPWLLILTAALLSLSAGSAGALTATYTLSSSGGTGILVGNAVACTDVSICVGGTPDFANLALAPASGTLEIVDSATPGFPTGTLSLSVPSLTLNGGPLGGVDEIILSSLTVTFSFDVFDLMETDLGGGLFNIVQLGAETATLGGTIEGLLGGGSVVGPSVLSETVTLSTLNCIVAPGQCGFQLDFTTSALGAGPLEFRILGNLNAVPEPALGGLVLLAVVALPLVRRR
jgi:hypothetical protein